MGIVWKSWEMYEAFSSTVLPVSIPFQVFLGIRWKALGFSVIQDRYRKAPVTELGVQQHPPASTLIQLLETTPPTNEETARQWFESLFECIPSRCSFILALHITPIAFQAFRNGSVLDSPSCLWFLRNLPPVGNS
jgi:hypothetical protein